jgi:5'-3' exonuclease
MDMGKVLIDGDIIAYRAAFSTEQMGSQDTRNKVDDLIEFILDSTVLFPELGLDYEVYLTGKGNFRDDIAKSYTYKGNRKSVQKPRHLQTARDHMESKYKANISKGEEADDLIAKEAARLDYKACVASIDKDMLQIPCWHFNIVRGDYLEVTPFGGIKFFYTQILTGDTADNIVGLFRVGPVKAKKILEDAETEEDLWDCVVKAYDGNQERVIENARLLWLRREEEEIWQPPRVRSDSKL